MFSTLSITNFKFSFTFILWSANAFNLDQSKILSFSKWLPISDEMYNQAAESAMEAMKGRLANKYYMLAEEAGAECDEEEEE